MLTSSVGLEGERKEARKTREPSPQHAQSSASFVGNGLVEQDNESGSQQPDEDLIADADDTDQVSGRFFLEMSTGPKFPARPGSARKCFGSSRPGPDYVLQNL